MGLTLKRKRKIYNLQSKMPKKRTVKLTFFSVLASSYLYLNYRMLSALPVSLIDYMDMNITEANSIGVSTLYYNCCILLFMCNTFVVIGIFLYVVMCEQEFLKKCGTYLKKAWDIFPD